MDFIYNYNKTIHNMIIELDLSRKIVMYPEF